jgi:hypothetical protein
MVRIGWILIFSVGVTVGGYGSASAQADTVPRWQARYGGGPSFGSPDSDFDGSRPPARWCLPTDRWGQATLGWLREVLSDPTDFGDGWRMVLGNAPTLGTADGLVVVSNNELCRRAAEVVNREVLGWDVGRRVRTSRRPRQCATGPRRSDVVVLAGPSPPSSWPGGHGPKAAARLRLARHAGEPDACLGHGLEFWNEPPD